MTFYTLKLRCQLAIPIGTRPARVVRRRPVNANGRTQLVRIFSTRRRTIAAETNQGPYNRRNVRITSVRTSQ